MFEGMARKMLVSISEEDIHKINAYQRTVSAGICTDKAAALRGPNQEYPQEITLIIKGANQDSPITIDITPQPNTPLLPDEEPFE